MAHDALMRDRTPSGRAPRHLEFLGRAIWLRDTVAKKLPRGRGARGRRGHFYEQIWLEEAQGLDGVQTRELARGTFEFTRGKIALRVAGDASPVDSGVALKIAGDKRLVYALLEERGVTLPRHLPYSLATVEQAEQFIARVGGPCVVKPSRNSAGGRGITTGVKGALLLRYASCIAAAHGDELLIEEQVPGDNYRLLFLDGELIDAIVRRAPAVVGDGRTTIRGLLASENARRRASAVAEPPIRADLEMRLTLRAQGLGLGSVVEDGRRVALKTVINQNGSADNASARDLLCQDIIDEGRTAAETVGARLAGVDVITADPRVPLSESGGVVLEVNTTPGFHFHYHPGADAVPVVREILSRLLAGGES